MESAIGVSYLVLWCVVLALSAVVAALVRQMGIIQLRLNPRGRFLSFDEGPTVGHLMDARERGVVFSRDRPPWGDDGSLLIAFASPSCGACRRLEPALEAYWRSYRGLVVATSGGPDHTASVASRLPDIPVVDSADLVQSWNIEQTPFIVALDRHGSVVAKGVANTLEQLESMRSEAIAVRAASSAAF